MLLSMAFDDWREPVQRLEVATGPASDEQMRLASLLGVPHDGEPFAVTAALLEDSLRPAIRREIPPSATPRQLEFLAELGHPESAPSMTRGVASAWIEHYLARRTATRLRELRLRAGETVTCAKRYVDEETGEMYEDRREATVSSIGANGLVYFKGGNGRCGWPSDITRE